MVKRRLGPTKGKDPYVAVAKVQDARNYSYRLQWLTQGPNKRDLPGSSSYSRYSHRQLASLPQNAKLNSVVEAMKSQVMESRETVEAILAKRQGKINIHMNVL